MTRTEQKLYSFLLNRNYEEIGISKLAKRNVKEHAMQLVRLANKEYREYKNREMRQNDDNLNYIIDLFFDAGVVSGLLNQQ